MPLSEPPASFDGFPELRAPRSIYRIHRRELDALYFSDSGLGRFDLRAPEGTLYAAGSEIGAFVEVFRSTLIPTAEVEARALARVSTGGTRLADCTSPAARGFGVTAAIHSIPDYALTQRWAAAFRLAGFGGVAYLVSHDPSASAEGFAIFGSRRDSALSVEADGPIDEELVAVARETFGLLVVPAPG